MDKINYVYIFVRTNLLPVQVAVQACHAAMQMAFNVKTYDIHPSLILIGVENEAELTKAENLFIRNEVKTYSFVEVDLNYTLTGFGVEPIPEDHPIRAKLKKFKLLPPFIHNRY